MTHSSTASVVSPMPCVVQNEYRMLRHYSISTSMSRVILFLLPVLLAACSDETSEEGRHKVPTVGFVQLIEDETVDEARMGFYEALREGGYDESKGTVNIIYRNAQGDNAALNQILDFFVSKKVDLIGANTTLAMITASGKTKTIPIFMMVAPSPEIAMLTTTGPDGSQVAPPNLLGTYETLAYIDTSVTLVKTLVPSARRVGTIYNSAEPNSTNAMRRLRAITRELGLELVEIPVTSSNETQQASEALVTKGIDVFFALPDNVIFSSFEVVAKTMEVKKIPILTSEAGLVRRGALAAYGADFHAWGHQAGVSAVEYLKTGRTSPSMLQLVAVRKRTFNPATAARLGISPPAGFEVLTNQEPEADG